MLPEALPPSATFRTKRQYFVLPVISQWGNSNSRRIQLPKCVYRHCGTAAAYIAWSCAKKNNLHSWCVSWMPYLFLEGFRRLHCYSGRLLPTRHVLFVSHVPICVNMDPHWCDSHDGSKNITSEWRALRPTSRRHGYSERTCRNCFSLPACRLGNIILHTNSKRRNRESSSWEIGCECENWVGSAVWSQVGHVH